MLNISFSWDDGPEEDLKMMDLSLKYGIPGMFFIPAKNPERNVLNAREIRAIEGSGFEIGAHTYSHKYLPGISINEGEQEIINGKDFLEQILAKRILHFCFPGGKNNRNLVEIAKQNFLSARTADTGALLEKNSFLIRPTIHFYDRGRKSLLYNSFRNKSIIFPIVLKNLKEARYFELVKKIIMELDNSRRVHRMIIWGHSWEIEKFSLWNEMEHLFQLLSKDYRSNLQSYSGIIEAGND